MAFGSDAFDTGLGVLFNLGVDNISVLATQSVASPSSLALFGLSIAVIGWVRRKKA